MQVLRIFHLQIPLSLYSPVSNATSSLILSPGRLIIYLKLLRLYPSKKCLALRRAEVCGQCVPLSALSPFRNSSFMVCGPTWKNCSVPNSLLTAVERTNSRACSSPTMPLFPGTQIRWTPSTKLIGYWALLSTPKSIVVWFSLKSKMGLLSILGITLVSIWLRTSRCRIDLLMFLSFSPTVRCLRFFSPTHGIYFCFNLYKCSANGHPGVSLATLHGHTLTPTYSHTI